MSYWTSLFLSWSVQTFVLSGCIFLIYKLSYKIRMRPSHRFSFLKIVFLTLPLQYFIFQIRDSVTIPIPRDIPLPIAPVDVQPVLELLSESAPVENALPLLSILGVILMMSYCCFVLWGVSRFLFSYMHLNTILSEAKPKIIDDEFLVFVHDQDLAPSAFGFFSPSILMPRNLLNKLTVEELRMVVLHENEHVKRRDPLYNAIRHLVSHILFFSPFVKALSRAFEEEMELSVDERLVDSSRVEKRAYGELLFDLCATDFSTSSIVCNSLSSNFLTKRIINMKSLDSFKNKKWLVVALVALVAVVSISFPSLGLSAKPIGAAVTISEKYVDLDYILVNLPGSEKLFKVRMTFEVDTVEVKDEITSGMPRVRDLMLSILSSKDYETIKNINSRETIKREMQDAVNDFLIKGKVKKVLFSEYIYT